jgi:succinoglycan biosynthesis transport protein ExoP
MSITQFILILRSRWRAALCTFGGVLLLAIAFSLLSTKQYTAVASVVIDMKRDPVAPVGMTDQLLTNYVTTESDIIASERVAVRAVKDLHLEQLPELQNAWRSKTEGQGDIALWIADFLLEKRVVVGPGKTKNGNIIYISAKWPEPHMAAAIANAFAQAAIETNIELKIQPAKQFASWFNEHSVALRSLLQARQKRLSDFENESGITATDEKLDMENARLAELSTQLVQMQSLRQDSQSRQRQGSGDKESLPEVLQSTVIASLKSALADAEARQSDIAGRLGKNHPDYQAAAAAVSNLHDRIRQESEKIAAALGSNTQINVRKESDVRLALEQQKKRVLELKHRHDEAAVLQSDVDTAQRDLDAVTQRFEQSSLESQEQQTNMVKLTAATDPFKPSSPKLALNLLAGLFLGGVLGVGVALAAERRDPRLRDQGALSDLLGVPTLVKIGSVKMKKSRHRWGAPRTDRHLEPSAI